VHCASLDRYAVVSFINLSAQITNRVYAHLYMPDDNIDAASIVCGGSRVCVTVWRPSVCLSRRSTTAATAGGFAAVRPATNEAQHKLVHDVTDALYLELHAT